MAGDEEDDLQTPTETSAGSASIGCDPYQRFFPDEVTAPGDQRRQAGETNAGDLASLHTI